MIFFSPLLLLLTASLPPMDSLARIAFAPDGHTIAVSNLRGLTVVDAAGPVKPIRLSGRKLRQEDATIAFSGDSRRVAADSGMDVVVWDIQAAKVVGTVHASESIEMSLSHDGTELAWCPRWDSSSSNEGMLSLSGVGGGNLIQKKRLGAEDVKFSPDGSRLAIACRDGSVKLLDPVGFQEVERLTAGAFCFLSLDFSPSGQKLLAGGASLSADRKSGASVSCVWDLGTRQVVWSAPQETLRQAIHAQFVGESAVSVVSMVMFFMGDGMDPQMREDRFALVPGAMKPSLAGVRYSGDGRYAASLADGGRALVVRDLAEGTTRRVGLGE